MKREIKFRVWNGAGMEYDVIVGKFGAFYVNAGVKGDGLDEKDFASLTPFNTIYLKDTPVMQSTGLKDKSGKEIYEGDILRLHCFNENLITATVEWDEEQARFIPHIHNKEIIVDGGTSHGKKVDMGTVHSWAGMHSCWSFERYTEIIGNIYQNPELLK